MRRRRRTRPTCASARALQLRRRAHARWWWWRALATEHRILLRKLLNAQHLHGRRARLRRAGSQLPPQSARRAPLARCLPQLSFRPAHSFAGSLSNHAAPGPTLTRARARLRDCGGGGIAAAPRAAALALANSPLSGRATGGPAAGQPDGRHPGGSSAAPGTSGESY